MERETLRILLVDDDRGDYLLTRQLLSRAGERRFVLDWVATDREALERMRGNEHDVCLLDYRLGESDGLELLREAIRRGCSAPLILLTGQGDEGVDQAAMRSGAADYLVKSDLTAPLLERSICHAIERQRAEAERI